MGWVKNKGGVLEIGSGMKGGREPSWLFVAKLTTKSMRGYARGRWASAPLSHTPAALVVKLQFYNEGLARLTEETI